MEILCRATNTINILNNTPADKVAENYVAQGSAKLLIVDMWRFVHQHIEELYFNIPVTGYADLSFEDIAIKFDKTMPKYIRDQIEIVECQDFGDLNYQQFRDLYNHQDSTATRIAYVLEYYNYLVNNQIVEAYEAAMRFTEQSSRNLTQLKAEPSLASNASQGIERSRGNHVRSCKLVSKVVTELLGGEYCED